MATCTEALLTSEVSGQLWNICAWDPSNGVSLASYKGLSSGPHTLDVIQDHYVISAANAKQLIHVWPLHKRSQEDGELRMACPGRVQALAVSPDGNYCVGAIAEKLHVWQVSSGRLLCVLSQHYQPVTTIRFTDDGSHFVSAGEDSMAIVWSMYRVLSGQQDKPRHRWSDHSLAITDIHIGHGAERARVVTGALDNTVRVYELHSGRCLCCVTMDSAVTAVTMDSSSLMLFVGLANGNISQHNFFEPPLQTKVEYSEQTENRLLFKGHSQKVTCLRVNVDSTQLVSGSQDMQVKLWDVPGRVCLRTIPHKGSITNIRFCPWSPVDAMRATTGIRWAPVIKKFQSHLQESDGDTDNPVTIWHRPSVVQDTWEDEWEMDSKGHVRMEEESGPSKSDLLHQVEELKAANIELFRMLKDKTVQQKTDGKR